MSIPILIDPACLSHTLYYQGDPKNELAYLKSFKGFSINLSNLLSLLRDNGYKIAMTKELFSLYCSHVPLRAHENDSLRKLTRELIFNKFEKTIKIVHTYGQHPLILDFDNNLLHSTLNHNDEVYEHWKDLSGLVYYDKLIPISLKSVENSIFTEDYIILNDDSKNINFKVYLHNNIVDIKKSGYVQLSKIHINRLSGSDIATIPCKGTGTHSSIWGKSIRSLSDVPKTERKLLKSIMETGLVRSISFLSFEDRLPAVSDPFIVIKNVEEKDTSDILECILRGKGEKQNAQTIHIEVTKGYGNHIINIFNGEITTDNIDQLLNKTS